MLLFSSAGQPVPKLNRIKEEEENGKLQTACLRDGLQYLRGLVVQKSIKLTLKGLCQLWDRSDLDPSFLSLKKLWDGVGGGGGKLSKP